MSAVDMLRAYIRRPDPREREIRRAYKAEWRANRLRVERAA